MSKIISPGIYYDMLTDDYFADPCVEPSFTKSLAKVLIEQTPLHARQEHPRLAMIEDDEEEAVEKYDKAKAIGNAAHAFMLQRGKAIATIDHPNFTTKEAKKDRDAALATGMVPILQKHHLIATRMVVEAKKQLAQIPGCERAFRDGQGEVVIVANEDGHWLRQMVDWATNDLREIWDYKTSGLSASPYTAGKRMDDAGWNIQAAMTDRILASIDPEGQGRRRYMFVNQEQYPPFALVVSEVDQAALTIGHKKLDYAALRWRECMASGVWPAYPPKIIRPQLPDWSVNRWIDREAQEYDDGTIPQVTSPRLSSLAGG